VVCVDGQQVGLDLGFPVEREAGGVQLGEQAREALDPLEVAPIWA
jgi:hypothetical protein